VLEQCDRCQIHAPNWEDPKYAVWYLGITGNGDYLGVVCPNCFGGDELAFMNAPATAGRFAAKGGYESRPAAPVGSRL
jgi:hypothetical protein